MKNSLKLLAGVLALGTLVACSEDEPETPLIPNEEELITTLKWQLISADEQDTLNFLFRDVDGDGGAAPTIETMDLKANTTYSASVQLLNELENPAEDITEEVSTEAEEHQFFYESNISGLSVSYADSDLNGNPVGISTSISTTDTSNGALTITLLHMPDKFANGVAAGDITQAGGETDISVSFNLNVQP